MLNVDWSKHRPKTVEELQRLLDEHYKELAKKENEKAGVKTNDNDKAM